MSYDATIIQEVLAGNRAAFGDLVRRYRSTVLRQVEAALKNPGEAEEITQDVFVHALERLTALKRHDRFEAWVRTIARRRCQDRYRQRPEGRTAAAVDELPDPARLAFEKMESDEDVRRVFLAIEALSDLEKRLLRERYLEEIPYGEMQQRHGLSYKALTMRLGRAREKVRRQLKDVSLPAFPLNVEFNGLFGVSLADAPPLPFAGEGNMSVAFDFRAPLAVRIDGKFGYVDKAGQVVIAPRFDRALGFSEGVARVGLDGKQGYIDPQGQVAIPFEFDEARPFRGGRAAVRVGEKLGFIDKSGAYVTGLDYDDAEAFAEERAAVKVGSKWGYIDGAGVYIAEPQFDRAWSFNDGVAPVQAGDKYGYIDSEGKPIYFWPAN